MTATVIRHTPDEIRIAWPLDELGITASKENVIAPLTIAEALELHRWLCAALLDLDCHALSGWVRGCG